MWGDVHQQGEANEDQAGLSQQGADQTSGVTWPPPGRMVKAPDPQEGFILAREIKPWASPVAQAALHAPSQRLPYVTYPSL